MRSRPSNRWSTERGAALVVSTIAVVALIGIGLVALVQTRNDTIAAGSERHKSKSLYAAESGVAAATDFLRQNCSTASLYSTFVEPDNVSPQQPTTIAGNLVEPGGTGYPFSSTENAWYEVTLLNNDGDPGMAAGDDDDGIIVIRSTGHGPGTASTTIEVSMRSPSCISSFCESAYAQENVNALNDTVAACATLLDLSAGLRTGTP